MDKEMRNGKINYYYFIYILFAVICIKFLIINNILTHLSIAFKPILTTGIIIYLLSPVVDRINNRTKLKRTSSVVLTFLLLILIVALFIWMVLPGIIDSIESLINNIPSDTNQVKKLIDNVPVLNNLIDTNNIEQFIVDVSNKIVAFSQDILKYSGSILTSVSNVLQAIGLFFLSLFMAFYALRDWDNIWSRLKKYIRGLFPKKVSYHIIRISELTNKSIKKFLIGKIYTCIILGIMVTLIIVIVNMVSPLSIPYAPLLGFVIGITNLIPYVGPIIGTVPCVFITLFSGVWEAVIFIIIVLVAQQVDNVFVSPKILSNSVGLKPFWIIFSVVVGGSLFGAIGMILSVPIVSVILYLIEERIERYYDEIVKDNK